MDKSVKNKSRPVNLKLTTISFPITAIISIFQRISGMINIISIGILLKLLNLSLSSPENFTKIKNFLSTFFIKIIVWCILTVIIYHVIGGIRHILMDFGGLAETQISATRSAYIVLIFTIIFSFILGVFIW
ncbi:MAG: succinate dehydrogenase, cytochrome b556 subunit [Candidatus Dasytiphilus stammeri]